MTVRQITHGPTLELLARKSDDREKVIINVECPSLNQFRAINHVWNIMLSIRFPHLKQLLRNQCHQQKCYLKLNSIEQSDLMVSVREEGRSSSNCSEIPPSEPPYFDANDLNADDLASSFIYVDSSHPEENAIVASLTSSAPSTENYTLVASISDMAIRSLTTSVFQSNVGNKWEECNINVIQYIKDKPYFKKYLFPVLPQSYYLTAVQGGEYHTVSVNELSYNNHIGHCYAGLSLGVSREEAEERYEQLLIEFKIQERHALHTTDTTDYSTTFSKYWDLKAHQEYKSRLREKRSLLLEQAVNRCCADKMFAAVFRPDARFLIKDMHYAPEYVACNDVLLFIYMESESELTDKTIKTARQVYNVSHAQLNSAREHYDGLLEAQKLKNKLTPSWFKRQ